MISRRTVLGSLAALPLLGSSRLQAQGRRVGGARIVVIDNRVWMQVRFGERGPYTFVIDTGAVTNLIRRDLARELGLRDRGERLFTGVGGTQRFTLYEGQDVRLGNTGIGDADFAGYDQEVLPIHREAMGALSASVLTVADSDLDFERMEWRIYPDGRGDRDGYQPLPSEIRRSPTQAGAAPLFVDAELGGQTYRLHVDTGVPGNVVLWPGASRRSGLWNDEGPFVPGQRRGVGGEGALARLVRVPELRVGHVRFPRALVSLTDPAGFDRRYSDGLIGIRLLEQMDLSTDVRANRLWARRNARPAPPERYGMSGLWMEERGNRLRIAVVSPQSPASEAGLQVGDEVEGTLDAWIERLGGRQGDRIEIPYIRGGQGGIARLTLREFL